MGLQLSQRGTACLLAEPFLDAARALHALVVDTSVHWAGGRWAAIVLDPVLLEVALAKEALARAWIAHRVIMELRPARNRRTAGGILWRARGTCAVRGAQNEQAAGR